MRRLIWALLVFSSACASSTPDGGEPTPTATSTVTPTATPTATATATPTPTETPPPIDELTLMRTLPHAGWGEGLEVYGGELWEARSRLHLVVDPITGEEKRRYEPVTDYSESIAWIHGKLWNVSNSDSNVWVGTPMGTTFTWEIRGTTPEVHAWGITWNGEHVIVTGFGSAFLYFLDPVTAAVERVLETPVDDLEDIAWDRGAIWASSYSKMNRQFFRIDAASGEVLDVHSLPNERGCDIVDGLAVADGFLYVTGKNCPLIWVYLLP